MPFEPRSRLTGPAADRLEFEKPDEIGASTLEGVGASFRLENMVGSLAASEEQASPLTIDPDHDPRADVEGTEFEEHLDRFAGSFNAETTQAIKGCTASRAVHLLWPLYEHVSHGWNHWSLLSCGSPCVSCDDCIDGDPIVKTYALAIVLALVACAKSPGDIQAIAPPTNSYQGMTCEQLASERNAETAKLDALSEQQSDARTADTIGVLLIGVPVGSFEGRDKEPEIAATKGRLDAINARSTEQGC